MDFRIAELIFKLILFCNRRHHRDGDFAEVILLGGISTGRTAPSFIQEEPSKSQYTLSPIREGSQPLARKITLAMFR